MHTDQDTRTRKGAHTHTHTAFNSGKMKAQIQMAQKHHLGIWAPRLQTQGKIAIFEYDAPANI